LFGVDAFAGFEGDIGGQFQVKFIGVAGEQVNRLGGGDAGEFLQALGR
jgi:hypothetical protein